MQRGRKGRVFPSDPRTSKNRAYRFSLWRGQPAALVTVSDAELNWRLDAAANVWYTMNSRDRPRGSMPVGRRAGGLRTSLTSTMTEYPESNVSLEQLISVLTKAVTTKGPARRYD